MLRVMLSGLDVGRESVVMLALPPGAGSVIKGWDLGVATMRKGEKAILTCGSDYAYGQRGSPPKIPGGATLNFEVPGPPSPHMSQSS